MDDRIMEIKDLIARATELLDEIIAEQEPADENQEEQVMPKEEYLAKPEAERAEIDQKQVLNRKPKLIKPVK